MFPNVIPEGFPIIICASLVGDKRAGYTAGFQCRCCGKELQVSPSSMPMIRQRGAWTFCGTCGMDVFHRLKNIVGVGFTPDALASLAKNIDTASKDASPADVEKWMGEFQKLVERLK
jgi:hypothetical protein